MTRYLLLAASTILLAAVQITPPLTAGEPFSVLADHQQRFYRFDAATQTWTACATPPAADCVNDTQNYNLRVDGAVAQTLPASALANGVVTFRLASGLAAGNHAVLVEVVGSSAVPSPVVTIPVGTGQLPAPGPQGAPTIARGVVVPPTAGLRGQYFSGANSFTTVLLTRTDATVNFNWALGSPGTGVPVDNFTVRWTGFVTAPTSGNYTFTTQADDGVRLFINNVSAIDNWVDQAVTTRTSAPIAMTAGQRVPLRLEFYERGGEAVIRLQWTPPGGAVVTVPATALTQ